MGAKKRVGVRRGHLHIDGVSGCAGDMFLAAMIDVGVPTSVIRTAIGRLGYDLDIRVAKIVRGGLAATDVAVVKSGARLEEPHTEHHHGEHDQHLHRHYREVRNDVESAGLSERVRIRALDIFDRLARAEASLHGTTLEEVAFHELGALDALADVVGAAAAVEWLAPTSVSASPVSMGAGRIKTAHGLLPVPSPAALEVLREAGAAMDASSSRVELCTPTGAAILASITKTWDGAPPMRPHAVGYGAGDLELADRPNVLRVTAGELTGVARGASVDRVVEIECNLDDMSAELTANAASELLAAGALDVWTSAVTMKKGRLAVVLSILLPRHRVARALDVVFAETSTLGVRVREVDRIVLERSLETVSTRFGELEVKVARRGGAVVNAAPEYESCARAAKRAGEPLKDVYAAAIAAYRNAFVGYS